MLNQQQNKTGKRQAYRTLCEALSSSEEEQGEKDFAAERFI